MADPVFEFFSNGGIKMRNIIFAAVMGCLVAFGGITAAAQCDRNTASPIRCGFYDEGYQDGVEDGRANRSDDYRRYRNKYSSTNQYEDFYRRGYSAGYDSVRPTVRWTGAQRNAYDAGYDQGQNDRRNSRGVEGGVSGRYDASIGLYYQKGYDDGFNNRPRQYDVPIDNNPQFPTPGGTTGNGSWRGRVDDRVNLVIQGATLRTQTISGNIALVSYQNMNGVLPRRATTVSAIRRDGRGTVSVIQQPNRGNDYTAIVQIYDRNSGADNYRVDIGWTGSAQNVEEPYRTGSVRWRGRVDQNVNIIISGSDVQSHDMAGTGLSNVRFDINGYLARRPGSVTVRRREGRGTVNILQQPSWENDFTAIVQIFDPNGGADDYDLDINW